MESIAALLMDKLLVVAVVAAGVQVITLVPLTFWVSSSTNSSSFAKLELKNVKDFISQLQPTLHKSKYFAGYR